MEKCLAVAERIVRALDDETIYDRYMKIKAKMMSEVPKSCKISPKERQLMLENRSLGQRLEELKVEAEQEKRVEEWVITQLQIIEKKIVPGSTVIQYSTFEDAANSLLDAIDTQIASHQFLKDKLCSEIREKQEAIQAKKNEALAKVDASRDSRIDVEANWERNQEKIRRKIRQIKEITSAVEQEIENEQKIETELNLVVRDLKIPSELELKKESNEERLNEAAARRDTLEKELSQIKFVLKQTDNEIAELERIRHLMVPDTQVDNLETQKLKLQREIDELQKQNKEMAKKLAKERLHNM